ncbi:endonuclease domain-containing 1 protein-like [Salvelinus fontinalis]|uniref:endonuclease domain-containing 1 protein-like n=1 Tax=Salvelinus fontinalis TaxID=8038 RepID=UPI0024854094|nr:endonuclease domain-containing 1 protein-like [Salvelinus fontinalis]
MMGVLNHLSTLLLLSLLPPALSHVVEKFSDVPQCNKFFLNGSTPNLPGILVGGEVQDQNHYKLICQKYNTIYRFATLYNTTNRIPVFSAYTFTGNTSQQKKTEKKIIIKKKNAGPPTDPTGDTTCTGSNQNKSTSTNRPTWMIEPQLEDINIKEMNTQHKMKKVLNKDIDIEEMNFQREVKKMLNNRKVIVNQAVNTDYDKSGLDRGHLFPCSYAPDDDTKRSTCTLTNAVPQNENLNRVRWCTMECKVREYLEKNCKDNNNKIEAYVVTGAVPNNNNNQLNHRVNIPDLLWTAFCCETSEKDKWMAVAHWGENKEGLKNTKVLEPHNLAELYDKLNKRYGNGVQLFPDQCPKVDPPRALPLKVGGDEHDHCVYDDDCVCSSVGVKGYYLPVVFVSVLVMMM